MTKTKRSFLCLSRTLSTRRLSPCSTRAFAGLLLIGAVCDDFVNEEHRLRTREKSFRFFGGGKRLVQFYLKPILDVPWCAILDLVESHIFCFNSISLRS